MNLGTVIVADDDASIRTVLNHALARAGFQERAPPAPESLDLKRLAR